MRMWKDSYSEDADDRQWGQVRPHPSPLPQERERDGGPSTTNTPGRVRHGFKRGCDLAPANAEAAPPLLGERAGVRADPPINCCLAHPSQFYNFTLSFRETTPFRVAGAARQRDGLGEIRPHFPGRM